MATRNRWVAEKALGGGAFAGLIGGVVLSIYALITSLLQGTDLWLGAKAAGAPFFGERALQPGFDAVPVIVGVLSHFAVSIVWGMLFGVFAYGRSHAGTLALGLVWGIVVWLGMFYAVLPLVGLYAVAASIPFAHAIAEHVLFGVAVAMAFIPFQREIPISRAPGERIATDTEGGSWII